VRLAHRITGDRDDALDVLQETFAYFWGKFPGFRLTGSLTTFLYPTVTHLALTRVRKRRPTVDVDALADELAAETPAREPGDAVVREIRGLPAPQREVLLLRFADDLSLQQIADALAIPLGTAKSRLHNALQALRGRLGRRP
jgi:RNA polymerase sigma-70 factor, ECF subfamily